MRTGDWLRRLDQVVLPHLARALARVVRGARRVRYLRAVATVVALVIVVGAVYASNRAQRGDALPPAPIVSMGVADGDSIPQYVRESKATLDTLVRDSAHAARPPSLFALVSFTAYLTPDQLIPILTGSDLQVTNVFMRVPSRYQTELVKINASLIPQDVLRGMDAVALRKAQDVADYQTLLSGVNGDTADDRSRQAVYRLGITVSGAEETAYREHCGCVYAAVVYATPAVLGVLAGLPGVRVVQPAAAEQLLDRVVFRPPLPDQDGIAHPVDPSDPTAAPTATP